MSKQMMKLRAQKLSPPTQSTSTPSLPTKSSSSFIQSQMLDQSMIPSTSKSTPAFTLSAYSTRRSSTASAEFSTPDSPGIGRIAKSNARILNGLDLSNRSRGYLDATIVLPDELKPFELGEKCPNVNKLIKGGEKAVQIPKEQLPTIQYELEELISLNVDFQKTIHGEITYLTTGDYPTADMKNRPMPDFELLRGEEFRRLAQRLKNVESMQNSSLADVGIMSSPEEDEPPHILDVPQRFWTWAKEYLRHISMDYVKEYKKMLLDRFSEEVILGKYCQDTKADLKLKLPPKSAKRAGIKRKRSTTEEDSSLSPQRTPVKQAKVQQQHRRSSLSAKANKSATECSPKGKRSSKGAVPNSPPGSRPIQNGKAGGGGAKSASVKQLPNGFHPRLLSNGVKKSPTKSSGRARKGAKRSAASRIVETPKIVVKSEEEQSSGDEEELGEEDGRKASTSGGGGGVRGVHVKKEEEGEEGDEDEVTAELRRKQVQLRELFTRTRPTIEQLYERVMGEYAVHEVFRQLDEADNKLYKVSSKYERLSAFSSKQQREEAKTAMQEHREIYAKFHGISTTNGGKKSGGNR